MLNQHRSLPQPDGPSSFGEGALDPFGLAHPDADAYLAIPEVIQHPPKAASQRSQAWRWLLLALLSCVATSAAAVGAFLWLINLPPTTDCDNAATVTTDRAQLYCAQLSADSGDMEDVLTSLALVGAWPEGHSLHHEVQPLVEEWSWVVLKAAEAELRNGRMDEAKALIGHIPTYSPVYAASQASLNSWHTEWDEGSALVAKADAALQQKDWGAASAQIQALGQLQNPHWRVDQVQTLAQKIRQERRAHDLLAEAVALASPGGGDQLGAAIRTASQIEADTFTHAAAQTYLDRWSDLLLQEGLKQWYASNLDQAIAMGRYVAVNPQRAKAAQELIWLSQARQMAQQSLGTWRTSPDQLITLYRAMLLANRIPTDSPFHPQAQSSVATWRTHLDDLGKLQTAQLAGRVHHLDALNLAINQAEKVPLGHPRRVQAQTMIAHWRQEIERIEDRPYLAKAHDLAQDKTLESLRAAIAAANTIAIHRALRGEAQSWIYVWQNQIEVLEDQPILDRARSLAAKGQLFQAIAEASGVKAGRALSDQAQAAINTWQGQIAAQEQARQRATRPSVQPSQPAQSAEAATALPSPEPAVPPAPASAQPQTSSDSGLESIDPAYPQRPKLPTRIETVPGNELGSEGHPSEPVGAPRPLIVAPAPKPDPVAPPPPVLVAPPPLGSPSPQAPPSPPAPAVPPAPINAPPPASQSSTSEDVTQGAAVEEMPTVSVRPQPELGLRMGAAPTPEVLYTGALYLG